MLEKALHFLQVVELDTSSKRLMNANGSHLYI